MTYNPNIPQTSNILSVSQGQLLTNFQQINTVFSKNHVAMNNATTANRGKHTAVQFSRRSSAPALDSTDGAYYTKNSSGTNVFWQRQGGAEVKITNVDPSIGANGHTFLPGGLLIQWGSLNVPSGESSSISFPVAFSSVPYSINVTARRSATASDTPMFVSSTHLPTATNFRIVNTSSNAHTGYWMALGPK